MSHQQLVDVYFLFFSVDGVKQRVERYLINYSPARKLFYSYTLTERNKIGRGKLFICIKSEVFFLFNLLHLYK